MYKHCITGINNNNNIRYRTSRFGSVILSLSDIVINRSISSCCGISSCWCSCLLLSLSFFLSSSWWGRRSRRSIFFIGPSTILCLSFTITLLLACGILVIEPSNPYQINQHQYQVNQYQYQVKLIIKHVHATNFWRDCFLFYERSHDNDLMNK